ncbi:hypothetical protein C3495_09775 [Clostridiaceae bacterium 14S0207]|nr:hypothetical protein C3495_09775 [Clostridiaceae bacterium 14S0207]
MSNKKKFLIFTPIFLVVIFSISYLITANKLNNRSVSSNKINSVEKDERVDLDQKAKSIKIIYESLYLKPHENSNRAIVDEYVEKFDKEKDIISKMSKDEILAAFKKGDYRLKDIERNKIVFSRKVNKYKYSPNKYVIGINSGYLAIFKSNSNGKLILESTKDITNIKIDTLTEGDIELLEMGDKIYEFNSKEDALEGLHGMFTT